MFYHLRVGVVIPALNEADRIADVIKQLNNLSYDHTKLVDDVVVCDNGSVDNTAEVAASAGARVVIEPKRGYGYACFRALSALNTVDVVVFLNGDGSDDVSQTVQLVRHIHAGADMVTASRYLAHSPEDISWHQRMGTKAICSLISLLWQQRITDLAPFRAIRMQALRALNSQQKSVAWLLEVLLKSLNQQRNIIEIPVTSRKLHRKPGKLNDRIITNLISGVSCFGVMCSLWWRRLKRPVF